MAVFATRPRRRRSPAQPRRPRRPRRHPRSSRAMTKTPTMRPAARAAGERPAPTADAARMPVNADERRPIEIGPLAQCRRLAPDPAGRAKPRRSAGEAAPTTRTPGRRAGRRPSHAEEDEHLAARTTSAADRFARNAARFRLTTRTSTRGANSGSRRRLRGHDAGARAGQDARTAGPAVEPEPGPHPGRRHRRARRRPHRSSLYRVRSSRRTEPGGGAGSVASTGLSGHRHAGRERRGRRPGRPTSSQSFAVFDGRDPTVF